MKKLILFFSVAFYLCLSLNVFAQVATRYSFSDSSGTYNSISGDTLVASATHTSIDPYQLNNANYGPNHVPFVFKFNGINYTDFIINSNGFITFGATSPAVTNYGPLSSGEAYKGAISAFGLDLIGLFGTTVNFYSTTFILTNVADFRGVIVGRHITAATGIKADTYITAFDTVARTITMSKPTDDIIVTGLVVQIAAGSIVRSTQGMAPFRVHTIQFNNFRQYLIIGTDDNFNFQIKLFETTGAIHVVYGNMKEITNTGGIFGQVGLRGSVNTDFNNRTNSVSSNWDASTAGTSNAATSKLSSTIYPVSGTTYIWRNIPSTLNVKVIPEGYYNSSTNKLNKKDTIRAYLRNNTFPYNVVDSGTAVLDSVTFTAPFKFINGTNGNYYIVIRHRNTIETWSKAGGETFTSATVMNYDFTNLITKAYGNNMIQVDAAPIRFAIYSGDQNQDGIIDATDISNIENDATISLTGYNSSDLTGDDYVDGSDISIVENNSILGIGVVSP